MVENKKLQTTYFFVLFAASTFLLYLIFKPFLQVIVIASILAVLLSPIYKKILLFLRGSKSLSALIVVLASSVIIAIPIYFLVVQILSEAQSLYTSVQTSGGPGPFLDSITRAIEAPIQKISPSFSLNISVYLSNFADFLLKNIGPVISGTAFVMLEILLTLITLYFFLKNGNEFVSGIIKLSPLDDKYDAEVIVSIEKTINSVLKGSLSIAVIQGFLVGTGLYIFHVPNPALWGMVAAFSALIPGMGTAFVTVPSILYLVLIKDTGNAIGLFFWSALLVGTVDNILAPYLYTKGIKIHPLFVFFSVLGGVIYFGPMGFLFGPIVLSLFLSVLHIYRIFILEDGAVE
ncbi:MAG: AI-2E family transporter [Candidatus Paceibacterota bacterium]|jgi:predicted PurR-regulated permease PerM|nr:AI-2E family transporter [Candidatus Paceibacterota bacterium]